MSDPAGPVDGIDAYPGAVGVRVVVADDSTLLREGLIRLLGEAGHEVVGDFADAESLVEGVEALRPELVILDIRMPPGHRDEGVRAAIELRRREPGLGILLLSQYIEVAYAQELLGAGSGRVGYLLKDRVASLDELVDAIDRIASGGTVLDPEVVRQLLGARRDPLATLTAREREVLELMAEGLSNGAIARRLFIGVGAVEKNVTSIFAKLGLAESDDDHRRVRAVLAWLDGSD